jgi:hypothetical protein
MSSTGTITVCINTGTSMKKNETILGGQLWLQEDRSMTTVNGIFEGMPNTRESAILSAAVEAVQWKHPIERVSEERKRLTSSVVIYPAEMPQLEEVLSEFSRNPSEQEDGSHIALSKILEKSAEYESADHPMATRSGCRAGGIRGVGGSGSTDTCVTSGHPSQT